MCDAVDAADAVAATGVAGSRIGNTCNPRARCWVWTWNNYEEKNIGEMKEWCNNECKEYVFQPEIGKECGTPHLQ